MCVYYLFEIVIFFDAELFIFCVFNRCFENFIFLRRVHVLGCFGCATREEPLDGLNCVVHGLAGVGDELLRARAVWTPREGTVYGLVTREAL